MSLETIYEAVLKGNAKAVVMETQAALEAGVSTQALTEAGARNKVKVMVGAPLTQDFADNDS